MTPGPRARAGFTLMEVLAVIFLIGLVLGVALDFYVDLSRATRRAADYTRGVRRGTAILDRVARDLEGAVLAVKPPATDPLAWPWLFLAESRYADGASDAVKFVTRNHAPRRSDAHESDLAVVAYAVRRGEADDLELVRWSSPRLPEGLDREFPPAEDARLVTDGLASFSLRFLGSDGEWATSWDSSQLLQSSDLPVAVEIELSVREGDPVEPEAAAETDATPEPERLRRTVFLPVRPLDLAALLDPTPPAAGAGEDEEPGEDEEGREIAGDPGQRGEGCASGPSWAQCIDTEALQAHGTDEAIQWVSRWAQSGECYREGMLRPEWVKPECR